MGGGGFFENCHDFNINNGNFTNVNGDYYSTDNSRRTIIQNSGNTTTTTYNNSFNNTPQTNYNHYDRATHNHGPVNHFDHVGNLNTGTNYGQIGNNTGWHPPPPSSNSPPFGAGYAPWPAYAQPWMYPPHPPSHPGSPPVQQSKKPAMGSNNPYFKPDVPFGPQAYDIPPTPQSAPEPRYGQSGGYFDPSSPPPQPVKNPSSPGLRSDRRSESPPQPPAPAPAPFPQDFGASMAQYTQNHLAFLQNQRNAAMQDGNLNRQMEHLTLDDQTQRPSPSPTPSARSSNGAARQAPVQPPQGHPSGANPWTVPNPSMVTMDALRRTDSSGSDSSDSLFTGSKKSAPENSRSKPSRFKIWGRGKAHQERR